MAACDLSTPEDSLWSLPLRSWNIHTISFVPHRPDVTYNTLLWVDRQRDQAGVEGAPSERKFKLPTSDGTGREVGARHAGVNNTGIEVGLGVTCYVPGRALSDFRPLHAGVLIP